MTEDLNTEAMSMPLAPSEIDIEHHLPAGWGEGFSGRLLFWIAVLFSSFQIYTAIYAPLATQVQRALHVGFLILVASAHIRNQRTTTQLGNLAARALGLAGLGIGLYHWIFYFDLVNRAGELSSTDFTIGIASLVILFVVSWRVMGHALPLICLGFIAYAAWGHLLPPPFDHRPFDFGQIIEQMSFGTEGVYATPTGISATYIYLFILFGAFLERAGMIQLFNDVALGLVGWARGGAAKVAVISSALMGTISGSGVANVVTVGQFTIPLMMRFGYRGSFAGGVEATASMGGQIMPPVMGAVAFIMAENINVPYAEIVKAAIIPAILYFASAFWMVHLEAGKYGLVGIPRAELPSPWNAFKRQWHLALPLLVLIWLLMDGYTPLFAGSMGLALTVLMILGSAIALNLQGTALRTVLWVVLGLLAASFLKFGVSVLLILIGILVAACVFTRGGRETLAICRDVLAEGARAALPVGLACAIVGTVIGSLTLTGTATIFGNWIVSFGRESLFLCLILVMVTSLVLGTGLPTIPTYIITASLAAPALYKLGVPLIISHMFVFYYGIIADLTPPVALAALAAAPIAKASPNSIGWQATRIAIAGFLIPFMGVYEPTLMMQPGGDIAAHYGYWTEVSWATFKACLTIMVCGVAAIGYFFSRISRVERILAGLAGALFILPGSTTSSAAIAIALVLFGWNFITSRRLARG